MQYKLSSFVHQEQLIKLVNKVLPLHPESAILRKRRTQLLEHTGGSIPHQIIIAPTNTSASASASASGSDSASGSVGVPVRVGMQMPVAAAVGVAVPQAQV